MISMRIPSLCTLLFFVVMLTGCQTSTGHYLGALADEDRVTDITPVLDAQQQWEGFYLTVDSQLRRQAGNYQMSGRLSFSEHARMMYVRVADVDLTLFLLNADNRVVDYRRATHFIGLRPDDRVPFTVTVPVSDQAVAYTFGYRVTFTDDEGGTSVNWHLPRTGR